MNESLPITIDMHAHLSAAAPEELALREEHGIYTLFSAGDPAEARRLTAFADIYRRAPGTSGRRAGEVPFGMTCGIHPWDADRVRSEDLKDYYARAMAIGEIGMDRVWCDVPLAKQEAIFKEQLMAAAYLKKPIILHTKGCEAEILRLVRDFPGKILVHWYSGDTDTLREYVDLGCYFTLGPDRALPVGLIPADRLFVETDGAEALQWLARHGKGLFPITQDTRDLSAYAGVLGAGARVGREMAVGKTRTGEASMADPEGAPGTDPALLAAIEDIPRYLSANMRWTADRKGLYLDDLHQRMVDNLREFLTPA